MEATPIVYKGKTAKQLAEDYDVFLTIPDPLGWLEANRLKAAAIEAELKPIKDLAYGDQDIQKLDIYAPAEAKRLPVFIDIHGGGWTSGSKNFRSIQAKALNHAGAISAAIDYGLAPSYSQGQMIDHVRRAISWVFCNISEYGGDPNQLYVFGNSAGAHLAATALMPHWTLNYGVPKNVIKGAVLVSGIFDLEGHVHALEYSHHPLHMTLDEAIRASPLHHLPKSCVPIIVAYGEDEPEAFILESQNYAQALTKAGMEVNLIKVPDAHHFSMIVNLAETRGELYKAVKEMLQPN